jgi:hypothetical protein
MNVVPYFHSTLYVSQPLNLPPLTAQATFDTLHQASSTGRTRDRWIFETDSAELRFVGCVASTSRASRMTDMVTGSLPGSLRKYGNPHRKERR